MNAREFDLSAMRRPDRTAGVALPPRPRPVTQPSNEPEAARQVSETPAPQAAAPTRRRSPRTASADSDGRLVIALPIPLRDRARAYAASHGYTYADVCLEAIETHHEHLSDLVDALRATSSGAETGVLFERRPTARATTPTAHVHPSHRPFVEAARIHGGGGGQFRPSSSSSRQQWQATATSNARCVTCRKPEHE